jgi:tungstate transport system ATP-binding protein
VTGPLLEARDVRVRYEGRLALAVDALAIQRGETLALIGPNGAGKSTLLRVLGLLERPEAGEVCLEGRRVDWGRDLLPARRRFASVFQAPHLIDATVARNVALGLELRGLSRARRRAAGERWMARLGIRHLADRQSRTLSGGEAQRTSLARALAIEPDVLLLDEPFSALDPPTREELLRDLQRLLRESPATTVFVTHDREEALRLGDRVGLLLAGRLAQVGTPDAVFSRPVSVEAARFVGMDNLWPGRVTGSDGPGRLIVAVGPLQLAAAAAGPSGPSLLVGIRPEDVELEPAGRSAPGDREVNRFPGRVTAVVPVGSDLRVEADCGPPLVGVVSRRVAAERALAPGVEVTVAVRVAALHLLEGSRTGGG